MSKVKCAGIYSLSDLVDLTDVDIDVIEICLQSQALVNYQISLDRYAITDSTLSNFKQEAIKAMEGNFE